MTVPSIQPHRLRAGRRGESFRAPLILTIVVLGLSCLPPTAFGQYPFDLTPKADTPVEGRLYNLTDEPFEYRLHRSNGPVWTTTSTIPPGGHHVLGTANAKNNDILGVRGDGKGFVVIQYSSFGGKVTWRLPARDPSNNKLEPNWFVIKDSNGFRQLIQSNSEEEARKAMSEKANLKPLTAAEIRDLKKSLRANWVLSDEGNAELTFRRGNTR